MKTKCTNAQSVSKYLKQKQKHLRCCTIGLNDQNLY